jgi:hypothetical protein
VDSLVDVRSATDPTGERHPGQRPV